MKTLLEISVEPTVASDVSVWPVKTSAMPQTTKESASPPIRIEAIQDLERACIHWIIDSVLFLRAGGPRKLFAAGPRPFPLSPCVNMKAFGTIRSDPTQGK